MENSSVFCYRREGAPLVGSYCKLLLQKLLFYFFTVFGFQKKIVCLLISPVACDWRVKILWSNKIRGVSLCMCVCAACWLVDRTTSIAVHRSCTCWLPWCYLPTSWHFQSHWGISEQYEATSPFRCMCCILWLLSLNLLHIELFILMLFVPSVLWHCSSGYRKSRACVL